MAVSDLIIVPIVLFALAMVLPAIFNLVYTFAPGIKNAYPWVSQALQIFDTVTNLYKNFDFAFLFVAGASGLAVIIGAFLSDNHPVFFVAALMIWVVMMLVVPTLSNAFNTYISSSAFSAFNPQTTMPITVAVLQHYPEYELAIGLLTFVALYARFQKGKE